MKIENPFVMIHQTRASRNLARVPEGIQIMRESGIRAFQLWSDKEHFLEPIQILGPIHIRPFWRENKIAPHLPETGRLDAASRGEY